MSGTWSGFSEEDIRKLKSGNSIPDAKTTEDRKFIKAKRREGSKPANSKKSILKSTPTVYEVPENAKLSESNKSEVIEQQNTPITNNNNTEKDPNTPEKASKPPDNLKSQLNTPVKAITVPTSGIEKRVYDLDEFQARQKLIEEQNRKRKELLVKALADRTKQTEQEARKLKEIQNEFKKLDALLSNDVSILRHQIEIASLEFMEAQKKYHRIEKEFLEAKLNLHQKLERKEMLTEHLCAIIEKNEERKAEKLSELINRLEVDDKDVVSVTVEEKESVKKDESNENGADMIDEVKNRREIKIDLQPEKSDVVIENGSE